MDTQKIWAETINIIKISISAGNFTTWFSRTHISQVEALDSGRQTIEVGCPSSFIADGLEKRYYSLIKESLDQVTKQKNDVFFVVKFVPPQSTKEFLSPLFSQTESPTDNNQAYRKARIREGFTFENFAVSSVNQMAWAASEAVSKSLGRAYNPLFLWGGVGVGKTHLMLAVGRRALQNNPNLRVLYCMGEEFTTEIVEAIRNKSTPGFKRRYRNLDLLMVDDIQFIAGKNTVQEEFFHTFNTLLREGGQIILTSDRPPSEIQKLEERLRSRFEAGLIVDISPPDYELRAAITLIKAQERGLSLPMDVVEVIAGNIDSLRRIEGFLTKMATQTAGDNQKATVALATSLLGKKESDSNGLANKKAIVPQEVIEAVSLYYSIGRRKLLGDNRSRPIAFPRQILMYLLRVELGLPLTEVGHLVGGRDHTTVMHATEKISRLLSTNPTLREEVLGIKRSVSG